MGRQALHGPLQSRSRCGCNRRVDARANSEAGKFVRDRRLCIGVRVGGRAHDQGMLGVFAAMTNANRAGMT